MPDIKTIDELAPIEGELSLTVEVIQKSPKEYHALFHVYHDEEPIDGQLAICRNITGVQHEINQQISSFFRHDCLMKRYKRKSG